MVIGMDNFHFFHSLDLSKASINGKWYLAITGLDPVNVNVYEKFHQNIPHDTASFTFSEFGPRQSLDRRQMAFDHPFG